MTIIYKVIPYMKYISLDIYLTDDNVWNIIELNVETCGKSTI